MSAVTTNPFAPSQGLFPVTKKPSEKRETLAVFVDLVYRHLDPDAFKNVGEFEQWFNKTLVPRVLSDFGDNPAVGHSMISLAFPHGGMKHFMRWVMMKFTTTKSPEKAVAAAKVSATGGAGEGEIKPKKEPELDFITEMKFEEDTKSIDFRCWVEGGKIRVKLLHVDTKGNNMAITKIPEEGEPGFGMPIKMLAHLVLEKAIPTMMMNEREAIQKYLKA